MRAAILFFLAVCVVATLGAGTVIDLQWGPGPGYVSLSPITVGSSGAMAIELQCTFDSTPGSSTRSSILFLSSQQRTTTANDVELYFTGQYLSIRVGTDFASSSYQVPNVNTWAYIAVNIWNDATTGKADLQLFINGVDQTGTLNKASLGTALTSAVRDYNFLGFSAYPLGTTSNFNGMVDTVQIWGSTLPASQIQSNAQLGQQMPPPLILNNLIVRFNFDEGFGSKTTGIAGSAAAQSYTGTLFFYHSGTETGSYGATFHAGNVTGTQTLTWCQGWGDPHWIPFGASTTQFSTQMVEGYFNELTCDAPDGSQVFTISTWHVTGCCWNGNTVLRSINVRLGNSVFQFAGPEAQANNIAGPWVYKEIPVGGSPSSVGWTSWSPSAGVPLILNSGLQIDVTSPDPPYSFNVVGAPFGYLDWADTDVTGGVYATLNMYIDEGQCVGMSNYPTAICPSSYQYPVPSWVYTGGSPATTTTPTPITVASPVAQVPVAPPCPSGLMSAATTVCGRSFPSGGVAYDSCILDVCSTGNPFPPRAPCIAGQPCCRCAATGACQINADNSTQCNCDAGFGGQDCSQVLNLIPLTLTTTLSGTTYPQEYDNQPYSLSPYVLDGAVQSNPTSPQPLGASGWVSALAAANPWSVKNSIVAYVGSLTDMSSGTPAVSQHLYFVADASSSPTGQSASITFSAWTGFSATPAYSATAIGSASTVSITAGATSQTPTAVTLSTSPASPNGILIPGLPSGPWCVTATLNSGYPGQVVVGSGNTRQQLDILKVVGNSYTICGSTIQNPCTNLTTCDACAANSACGWCRSTGDCRYGRAAGPTDGTMCNAWAYGFQTGVSRRITQTYGYPVSPVDTTVTLSSGATTALPVEINVDMGFRYYSAWDVQILFPANANNQADLAGLQAAITDISSNLAANYVNSALALSIYTSTGVKQIFPLVNPNQASALSNLVAGINLGTSTASTVSTPSIIYSAVASQGPNWRANTRRLLIVFSTDASSATPGNDLNALISNNVLPVFVPTASAASSWASYATALNFGILESYTSPSAINVIFNRAMTDASGAISTFAATNTLGQIDHTSLTQTVLVNGVATAMSASLQLTGLSGMMRSRNVFPMSSNPGNSQAATIYAPGFGQATIEAVIGDAPYTTAPATHMVVGQILAPWSSSATGTVVYLTGKSADVLSGQVIANPLISATIQGISYASAAYASGALYQFNETILNTVGLSGLTPITNFPTVITDVQARIIFLPAANTFSTTVAPVYATITYSVADECETSANGTIPLYVDYADNVAPNTTATAAVTTEDNPVLINITGVDVRGHTLRTVITQTVTSGSSNAALTDYLFQYTPACMQQLQAAVATAHQQQATGNIQPYGSFSSCVAINNGDYLTANSTSQIAETYTTVSQMIYFPPRFANTDGIPAVYKIAPSYSYQMIQVLDANDAAAGVTVPLTTPVVSIDVTVAAVNDAPTVAFPSGTVYLSFVAPAALDAGVCGYLSASNNTVNCNWQQNLGVAYPSLPSPENIYFQGSDVDSEELTVWINSVSCVDSTAVLRRISDSASFLNVTVNTTLNSFAADTFASLLAFLPTQDGAGLPYCTITYQVSDGELISADKGTIVIGITSVPLPPRSQDVRVYAPTLAPVAFNFTARAVSNLVSGVLNPEYIASVAISGCTGDSASSLSIGGVNVDCSKTNIFTVASTASDYDYLSGKVHTFTGSWTPTAQSSEGFAVTAVFTDTQNLTSIPYSLSFAYIQVNQPPMLQRIYATGPGEWLQTQSDTASITLKNKEGGISVGYNAEDVDSEGGIENAVIVLSNNDGSSDLSHINLHFPGDSSGSVSSTSNGVYMINAPVAAISQILATMSVQVSGISSANFTISITLNDNGFTGVCSASITGGGNQICNKQATAVLSVIATSAAGISPIGAAAGAGGAAAAAAAAAAVAWKKLRSPPTESYNPWEMDDSNEGAVMSPLYEASGKSGDNLLYVAAGSN